MVLGLLESGQVQLPDLGARNAENLSKHLVAHILLMSRLRNQFSKLELDNIVYLLLGELFHLLFVCRQADFGNIYVENLSPNQCSQTQVKFSGSFFHDVGETILVMFGDLSFQQCSGNLLLR